ncbi:methylmalonyl-CoA mutase subunit beta [Neobacillus terrae]|uniref:methylmalonyl-CoA mutase subunit beta n=1 Tax=Neobacillus terrae TaxID=3034837 RepID=UPI00140A8976|nr:methylmalonyl-CoA mutase subunit beta [Neobacillus terrae]NHM32168.1 methylmalonyl-CoA mutase [Neobacillus terrae]
MELKDIIQQSFPEKTEDDWRSEAERTLKGKSVESLKSNTYENIILKPLYSLPSKNQGSDYPGGPNYRRGINPAPSKWKVAQRLEIESANEFETALQAAFKKGQTSISFNLTPELVKEKDQLLKSLEEVYEDYPFAINAGDLQKEFLEVLASLGDKAAGYIGFDPISSYLEEGVIPANLENNFNCWIKYHEKMPYLRTILVNSTPYHNGGANAVQELAISIAEGTFYLQELLERGMNLEAILSKMVFQFSIGANFFMEIAKLRAARLLWDKAAEAYEAPAYARKMHISAETSSFTKTIYDKHVNILRAGNEAFAAAIGNVQYLHVSPFDELHGTTPLSNRVARNTQLILQEEAHLTKVADPAGGSWYIEELTNELAEKAWALFLEIDSKGGIIECLKSGWIQQEIQEVLEKRKQDAFTRKQSIIGTNAYANLLETAAKGKMKLEQPSALLNPEVIQPIKQFRLAEPFEEQRERSEKLAKNSGTSPSIGLICLGELKQHKPRADFISGFVSAGGIKADKSEPLFTQEEAKKFVSTSGTNHFCFCGQNEQYQESGFEMLKALKKDFPETHFYLAGLPEKEEQEKWLAAGINQFIHIRSNCFQTLSSILTEKEGGN